VLSSLSLFMAIPMPARRSPWATRGPWAGGPGADCCPGVLLLLLPHRAHFVAIAIANIASRIIAWFSKLHGFQSILDNQRGALDRFLEPPCQTITSWYLRLPRCATATAQVCCAAGPGLSCSCLGHTATLYAFAFKGELVVRSCAWCRV
jgi:hypothetical protein